MPLYSATDRSCHHQYRQTYLTPAFSIHRVEPDVSLVQYGKKCNYTDYLYLGQEINDNGQIRLPYCHEIPNAFGYVVDPVSTDAMRVRPVNPIQVDLDLVHRWLSLCEKSHGDFCKVMSFQELSIIRLIDVHEGRIVPYTQIEHCQYLCLSYVWGGGDQQGTYDHSALKDMPATISDAMEFVRLLGKRYLWIDAVRSQPRFPRRTSLFTYVW